jgi:hypothetical protein
MPSFDVLADLERIFLRYGRPPLKNGEDRRSVLGPFADPEAFRPLLRDAATAIMAAKTRRAKGKTSPMELGQVFLRLTAAATPSSAPVRQAAARRL